MQRRNWLLLVTMTSISAAALMACSGDDTTDSPDSGAKDASADHATKDSSPPPDTSVAEDASTEDGHAPDTSVPDSDVADTNVGDTSVGDTNVGDTNVGDTNVADSHVADTSVPDSNVADTSVADAADSSTPVTPDAAVEPCPAPTDGGAYTLHTLEFTFATTSVADGGKGQTATINHCDSVRWHNGNSTTHGVESTSGPTPFNTGNFGPGAMSPAIQFPTPGTEDFRCTIHTATMKGELTIQ
jgi:hypothetical protein